MGGKMRLFQIPPEDEDDEDEEDEEEE